jgi:SAM-dependent methyltransferase
MRVSLGGAFRKWMRRMAAPDQPVEPPDLVRRGDPSPSARYLPMDPGQSSWLVRRSAEQLAVADDGMPIPPQALWAGYCDAPAEYVELGKKHHAAMMRTLSAAGFAMTGGAVLELGCAAGRILRNFKTYAEAGNEVWGCDLSAQHMMWCRRHLSPPFRFVTNTTLPHLPFEDSTFALIYASSVFTHIGDLEDAWLCELRRILKPGGCLYLTIHDNHTIDLLLSAKAGEWLHGTELCRQLREAVDRTRVLETGFDIFLTSREPGNTQVFHDIDYVKKAWGQILPIVQITPEDVEYQTSVILAK